MRPPALLAALPLIDYDLEIAQVHAALWAELSSAGARLSEPDQMIAATALTRGYDLATRDAAFRVVPDLTVRVW